MSDSYTETNSSSFGSRIGGAIMGVLIAPLILIGGDDSRYKRVVFNEITKTAIQKAFENPKFVEDIVRDLAVALERDKRITWFQINSENFESIHNHNA